MKNFCVVDVESNGLHGQSFAVGAVVVNADGVEVDRFCARTPIIGDVDEFVMEQVLPAMSAIPVTHDDPGAMVEAFVKWFEAIGDVDLFVDVGYPVETTFFIGTSLFGFAPYPVHEVATLFLAASFDPDCDRAVFARESGYPEEIVLLTGEKHDPVADARASASCVLILRRVLNARRDALAICARTVKETEKMRILLSEHVGITQQAIKTTEEANETTTKVMKTCGEFKRLLEEEAARGDLLMKITDDAINLAGKDLRKPFRDRLAALPPHASKKN